MDDGTGDATDRIRGPNTVTTGPHEEAASKETPTENQSRTFDGLITDSQLPHIGGSAMK